MNAGALPRRVAAVAIGMSSVMVAWLLLMYVRMIVSPAQQEMREGAAVWITRLLIEGRNPYALSELPASTNVYGIFYHLVVMPFALVFGNGFAVHRIVSGLSIAGACALLYRLLRLRHTDPLFACVGALMFFVSSLYFVAPLARPDGLGLLLSMASITVLFKDDVTPRRFGIGLAFALLALSTKIYLAYPPFVAAAYMFVFRSRRRGLMYGLAAVFASIALLLALTLGYPAYLNVSLVSNAVVAYDDGGRLVQQTLDWLVFSLPLTVALVMAAAAAIARARAGASLTRPGVFAFAAAANSAVFFYWLGWHPGAHMTYLFQLVTPVLIPALLPGVGQRPWPRALVAAALPLALGLNAHYFPMTLGRFAAADAQFAGVTSLVGSYRDVLGSTEVAGVLALAGRPVVDSGQSEYFGDASTTRRVPGIVPAPVIEDVWDAFQGRIADDIRAERFDLVIRSRRHGLIPRELLAEHYHATSGFDLDFVWSGQRWPVDVWEPGGAPLNASVGTRGSPGRRTLRPIPSSFR